MKQLEIKTNKRLLIVEYENFDDSQLDEKHKITLFHNGNILKFICKGSDLIEGIAKGFTHSMNFGTDENPDIGYHHSIKDNYWCESALESFISAIESKGYHWGENPVKNPESMDIIPASFGWWLRQSKKHEEAQAMTFNPSKCIIFEIV